MVSKRHCRRRVVEPVAGFRYHLAFERECVASADIVYDLLADVEQWPQWLSGVRSASWEHPNESNARVRRLTVSGLTMREKILVADRPHHHAYAILSGIPVVDHRADVYIHGHGTGSLIVWQAEFGAKQAFLGPLIWLMLRASMPRMVTALARGAERLSAD